jgi:hypothetical protein
MYFDFGKAKSLTSKNLKIALSVNTKRYKTPNKLTSKRVSE